MNFEKDLGKVGLTTAGTWSSNASYERLTVVTWRGRSFLSKITNKNVEPGTNSDVWQLIAEKGADGQGGSGGGTGTTDIGVARYSDGILYWTKNGVWLLDEYGNKVKAQGVDGKDGKDGKDGEGGGGGGSDTPSISKFKSYVFIRSLNTPTTPQGGSFDNPVPTGWSDGIPAGDLQVWTSSRWFYSDDSMTAQTSWSVPIATTDTAEIDFEFSSVESPGNPDTNKSYWHDPAREGDKWMAIQITRNGRPLGWSVVKIAGENGKDGKDGASFNILGSYDTIEEAEIAHPNPSRNDVVVIDGELYIWDGEQWVSMGVETTLGMFLSTYAVIFQGNGSSAVAGNATVEVYGLRGMSRVATTIGQVTGLPTGMSISLNDNGTDHASFTLNVTTSLVTNGGQITVPVTADGEQCNLNLSWAVQQPGAQGQQGEDGDTGENGYSNYTLLLYQRAATSPSSLPGTLTYNFANDTITGQLNGWNRVPPEADGDPLWMIQASGSSTDSSVNIGSSDWNGPLKFVENGYPGKTMRGPSLWKQGVYYQGLANSESGFVDLVYADENYATLYYCYQNTPASSLSNKPGTTGGEEYWVPTEVKDFVATKLFFSNLGFVENLGVNNLLLSDHGYIFGGLLPANTHYDAENPQTTNGNTILWVGSSVPSEAPFQVDASGNGTFKGVVDAESGSIGPYSINQNGILYQDTSSTGSIGFYGADVSKAGLRFGKGDSSGDSYFYVDVSRGGSRPLIKIGEDGRDAPAVSIESGYVAGLNLRLRTGGSSDMTLYQDDNLVIFNNNATRTIYLPGGYDGNDGRIIFIIHTTSSTLRVTGASIVQVLSTGASVVSVAESGRPETLMLIWSAEAGRWYLTFLKSS